MIVSRVYFFLNRSIYGDNNERGAPVYFCFDNSTIRPAVDWTAVVTNDSANRIQTSGKEALGQNGRGGADFQNVRG